VYSEKNPDDGQRNSLKHVKFQSKNKFEKLVHLVGFIIRIYHDARSPERQIRLSLRLTEFLLTRQISNQLFVKGLQFRKLLRVFHFNKIKYFIYPYSLKLLKIM